MTKNNLPKYSHVAYDSLLSTLEKPVNLVKSIASKNFNNLSDLKKSGLKHQGKK